MGTPFVDRGEKVLEAMAMVLLDEHSKEKLVEVVAQDPLIKDPNL
jgi:hypothetical protein